jgi:hypothetical protein
MIVLARPGLCCGPRGVEIGLGHIGAAATLIFGAMAVEGYEELPALSDRGHGVSFSKGYASCREILAQSGGTAYRACLHRSAPLIGKQSVSKKMKTILCGSPVGAALLLAAPLLALGVAGARRFPIKEQ